MLDWLRSRFQIQRVEMDHDLMAIIEGWPKLNRQQRDRVKLLVIQGARARNSGSTASADEDDRPPHTN